jgi:FAD/FMN-containing dehydrogenase
VQRDELLSFLTEFAADRLALIQRHEAAARVVSHYDFNNAYQYVIAREETHLGWLETALTEIAAPMPPPASIAAVTGPARSGKTPDASAFHDILSEDARLLAAFVDKWRDRVTQLSHARHRTMLNVVLGESLEHQRLFEQGASGLEDVIGRRTGGVARVGAVLPARWQE